MAVLVVLLVLLMINSGISQPVNPGNNVNTPIGSFCGRNRPIILSNFINNRNSTFAEIRRQLSSNNVFYARAQSVTEGDSVFGAAQCRNYLSTAQCVACFNAGVSELDSCITGNGAYVFFDNCFVRYANYDAFYNDPNVGEDAGITPLQICGNQSASQPTTIFTEAVDGLLSDIKDATPKTSNFYVASTRQITNGNATVYSIAQCVENTSPTVCQTCLNTTYTYLYDCLPNTEGKSINMGCFARYSETPFFNDNQTIDISSFLHLKGHSSKVSIIAGAIGGTLGQLFIWIVLWFLLILTKKSKKSEEGKGPTHLRGPCDTLDTPEMKGVVNYDYKYLQLATNNFSEENIIGKGGFGEVFKANLDDNKVVAVKKLKVRHVRAKFEFENEVLLTSHIRHRNLLCLLGYSSDVSNLLLIVEYMPNGSLDKFLWGTKKGTLNWRQRYDIIFGIARGLAHLHKEFHAKIIHRDIKSSNILLDDNFQPKIADFGLARFQPKDQTHVVTKFGGTLGYIAPEYALHGHLTEKADTFSFGIVILEIISGRKCTDITTSTDYLLEHAWKLYENNEHVKLIDETMDANQYEKEHVMKIIEIALLCTQSPISRRPDMSEVVPIIPNAQAMAKREIIRPIFMDLNRRVHIDDSKNSIGIGNVKLHNEKADDEGDVMEKGIVRDNLC